MKKASMLVFRRITSADFYHIYKERGAEEGGGGQSYIDVDTSGVSISDWRTFFSGINPTEMKGGPLWKFEIHSLGIGKRQFLKIGQRRATSVSIREQKLASRRSNRVRAWHPEDTQFPHPTSSLSGSSDPQIEPLIDGLVVFIIRAVDNTYWAGWMRIQDRPDDWLVPNALNPMFENDDGFIRFEEPIDFDETKLNWPFHVSGTSTADTGLANVGEVTTSQRTSSTPRGKAQRKFRELTEDDLVRDLFDADYSAISPGTKQVVTQVRQRNQKAVRALKELYGECQISGSKFVFKKVDGNPYLEVHHLIPLGLGGADKPANLVVLSAHMHRMLHYADVGDIDLSKISDNKLQIQINGEDYIIRWHPRHAAIITGE